MVWKSIAWNFRKLYKELKGGEAKIMDNIKKLIKKEKNERKKLIILYILITYSWNDATEQIIKRIKVKITDIFKIVKEH